MLPSLFTSNYLARLETLRLRTKRKFLGSRAGSHLSLRRGPGLEFADYQRYTPGDDLRYVDWNLYSRTDHLYVKQYQEEQELFTSLFLDNSASMQYPTGNNKYESGRDIALSVGYIVLAGNDAFRLSLLARESTEPTYLGTPFYRGRQKLKDLARHLENSRPGGQCHILQSLASQLQNYRRPGKAIWVSDFLFSLTEFRAGLTLLQSASYEVAVVQVLGHDELDPPLRPEGVQLADSETEERANVRFDAHAKDTYLRHLHKHNREIESSCHRRGARYAQFNTVETVPYFILRKLPELGLLH